VAAGCATISGVVRRVVLGIVVTAALTSVVTPESGATTRTIRWSGYRWEIKASTGRVGPGPNYFSAASVRVDARGRLHLGITKAQRRWYSAEIGLDHALGYGTYTWKLASRVDQLDPNAVLGLFTYDDTSPAFAHREIDIEASRWGVPDAATNAQFVVQPWDRPGNLRRIRLGSKLPATLSFTWRKSGLAWRAPQAKPSTYTYRGADRPPRGNERARINLWLYRGRAPARGRPVEVVIRSFRFQPG
jgi:hypothetical protein